jgi:Papain-like cysteine protease AvrRpt2
MSILDQRGIQSSPNSGPTESVILWRRVLFAVAVALVICELEVNPARSDNCPDIKPRINENEACNPNDARTKACDTQYQAPSKRWVACYDAVSACRKEIAEKNTLIHEHNSRTYQCRASVAAEVVKRQGEVAAHSKGILQPLKQPANDPSCWAYVATMMYSWKQGQSASVNELLRKLGPSFQLIFDGKKGLGADEKAAFLSAMGLVAEPPQNYTAKGWADLIRRYGPLWVTTVEPGATFSHARIITGIFGDGSLDRTYVVVADPQDGELHTDSLRHFETVFEQLALVDMGSFGDIRPQVVHY